MSEEHEEQPYVMPHRDRDAIDLMLYRRGLELRRRMRAGQIDPLRIGFVLQSLTGGNPSPFVTLGLRPTFLRLQRPSLVQVGDWLETSPDGNDHRGIDPKLRERLDKMNWRVGPAVVDLTLGTAKNLFLPDSLLFQETEMAIRTAAKAELLQPCPDWVVPALGMWAQEHGAEDVLKGTTANLCLESDDRLSRDPGFAMWIRRTWSIHARSLDAHVPWSSSGNWLFVKPLFEVRP